MLKRTLPRESEPTAGVAAPGDGGGAFVTQMFAECEAMSAYALASGLRVPSSVLENIQIALLHSTGPDARSEVIARSQIRRLVQAHDHLVQIVSPATPRTLILFEQERASGKASALGPVRLVRHMMVVSGLLLLCFLGTALSPEVTHESGDIFNSSGLRLAVNELFLLSAAGIGASFAALFRANRYIAEGTYDAKYESSYWIRFVLGLLAGIVLASLIPIKDGGSGAGLTKPFLSLLGGFSASVVFRILTRVVGTLESLVQGDSRDAEAAARRTVLSEASTQRMQDQMRVSAGLVKLREQLGAGMAQDEMVASVNRILDELLPVDVTDDGPTPSPQDERTDNEVGKPSAGAEMAAAEVAPALGPPVPT